MRCRHHREQVNSLTPRPETVLVIEYGKVEGTVGYFDPPEDGRGASRLVISSPPVASVNNRAATVILGMTVGGGSAVNGQFLDRPSKYDYDEWANLFEDSEESWDWENFGPFLEKVSFCEGVKRSRQMLEYTDGFPVLVSYPH